MIELTDEQTETAKSLYTLGEAQEILSKAKIQSSLTVADDTPLKFSVPKEWSSEYELMDDDSETEAILSVGGKEYTMTRRALEMLGVRNHITRKYMSMVPPFLLQPHMGYWLDRRTDEFRVILDGDKIVGLCKSSKVPLFSSQFVLDVAAVAFSEASKVDQSDLLVDYKFYHDLDTSLFRLIDPTVQKTIASARDGETQEDLWSNGLAVTHSQTGQYSTTFEGYMFAWWCTNGNIATHASSGKFDRRSHSSEQDEMIEWADFTLSDILADLPMALTDVEVLPTIDLKGEMSDAASAVFKRFKVPTASQGDILTELVETDDWSAYGLMQAITQAANPSTTDEKTRVQLFRAAGDMAAAYTERCESCHRI